jgi:uncharacterized lipoprotein YmbA
MLRSAILAATLAIGACASPEYHLLPPPAPVARAPSPAASIAVAEVSLPSYAGALEIAVLTESGAVTLQDDALWADTPRRALTRHLVAALQQRLSGRIGTEPWPGFDGPALRVEVVVDRMIGAPAGPLDFAGQYIIAAPESGRITASNRFAITIPPQGDGYDALLAAHALAIDALADRIAASVTGRATS